MADARSGDAARIKQAQRATARAGLMPDQLATAPPRDRSRRTVSQRAAALAVAMTQTATLTEAQLAVGADPGHAGAALVQSMRPIVAALGRINVDADYVARRLKSIVDRAMRRTNRDTTKAADVLAAIQAIKAIARIRGDLIPDRPDAPSAPPLPNQLIIHVTNVLRELHPQHAIELPSDSITLVPDVLSTVPELHE